MGELGCDGFGRWTIASMKKWMVGCAIFNTATLTVMLANFGPYGNFINGVEHEPREEFRDYSYMRILSKNFPWGDGKHTLFFNEETIALPGKGYIRDEELHVPLLLTLRNLFCNQKARWNTQIGDQEPTHGWKPIPGVDDHHH